MNHRVIKIKALNHAKEWLIGSPIYEISDSIALLSEGLYLTIKEETICQSTSLLDSQKNEIFENDIISVQYDGEEPDRYHVFFNKVIGQYRLQGLDKPTERSLFPLNERAIIIGNVLDNE